MDTPTFRIVWWALLSTLLVYLGVAFGVAPEVGLGADVPLPLLAGALGGVALALGVASLIVRRRALVGPIQAGALDPATPEGRQRATAAYVVCLVLSESVGLFGLVLALLSGDGGWSLPFVGAAFALILLHRPSASDLQPPRSGPHAHLDPRPIA
jgi:hypothetical protein